MQKMMKKDEFAELEKFRIQMQREHILQKLKEQGYRVTKQRIVVIDIILENEYGSVKEIIYRASKGNRNIGSATVYRTLNMLEEIGAIHRRNAYQFSDMGNNESGVLVLLENGEEIHLNVEEWNEVMQKGMEACGYLNGKKIISVEQKNPVLA